MIMGLTAFFRSGILLLREFRGGTVSVPDLRRKEKHVKKRIFSFLLAVLMLAALLPTAAFADESTRKAVPVTGGNIYVDMEKGEVVDCDDTVTEMIVPEQVDGVTIQAISDRAFQERKNLKRVTLPGTLQSVGSYTFYKCTRLKEVTIGDGVPSVENHAFSDCSNLERVRFPKDMTMISQFTFYHCERLKEVNIPENVTWIGKSAFSGCSSLKSITFPDKLETIEPYAFLDCTSLQAIEIPDSVISIGNVAFENCKNAQTLTLGNSLTELGAGAFSGCESLTRVVYPASLKAVGGMSGCKNLTEVVIPDTATEIMQAAFSGCTQLQELKLPSSVKTIGSYAFASCGIQELTIPDGVEILEKAVMQSCANLQRVSLPDSITEIGDFAFAACNALKTIKLPSSLKTIGYGAFMLSGLTELTIPDGVTALPDGLFYRCKNLTSVTIPGTVKQIKSNDFFECTALTSIVIPEGVEWISQDAFLNCTALETVWLPLSLKAIEGSAFFFCTNLKTVEYAGSQDDWDQVAFDKFRNESLVNAQMHFANLLTADKFSDVSHNWAYDGINYCYTHRLMRGIDGERFAPKVTTTRAQIVQILYNLQGEPEVSGPMPFDDVFNHWAEKPILWAYQTGVVAGTSDTTFDPDKPVTREQIAVILMGYVDRILKLEHTWEPADLSGYPDAGSVSGWAKDALADAVALGLISGASNGGQTYLDPQGGASREQVATILMEFCKNVMNKQ